MSPASKSKSKGKKAGKELQKVSSNAAGHASAANGMPVSGYNPLLGKFHTLETAPLSSTPTLHVNGRFRNIDEADDHFGNSNGTGMEYDIVSNNDSWSGESEDHKEKSFHAPLRHEAIPGADNDKREKIRQKNERKHQRQKERRAQELHERCSGFIMSRKLEALAQQLVAMGFSSERATLALILNEGKIEESVAWLFEGGEEADKHEDYNLDGGNLKIDISEELAHIADMEIRYKCSKQKVERAIVACEGDLEKAAETLRVQKHDLPSTPPKPDETGDPPSVSNSRLLVSGNQNSLRGQLKPNTSTSMQQRKDEKDFNYTKAAVTVGLHVESGSKSAQVLRKVQPKLEWAKPQQIAMPTDKRWPTMASNPSVSYSVASPLQATPPPAKTEARFVALGSELKNLQLGSVREPVVVMQRPQSANAKQASTTSISSSPPGTASGQYTNNAETVKLNGLSPHFPNTRTLTPNIVSSSQLYNQLRHERHPQFVSSCGQVDSPGASRGNGLWNKMGTSPTLAAASSLGLFSTLGSNGSSGSSSPVDWNTGVSMLHLDYTSRNKMGTSPALAAASSLGLFSTLGSNGSSGSSSPVDWNTGVSMLHLDYTSIDWTLDRASSNPRSSGVWSGMTSVMQHDTHIYDSYAPGMSARRPALANGGGGGGAGGSTLAKLQDGGVDFETSGGVSREWSSPFEEKDLFSLPRQFVSSPSL